MTVTAMMTNAERQKQYRDRKRGGPPVGRWHGHDSAAKWAERLGIGRSQWLMIRWICRHAPDVHDEFAKDEKLKITPTYHRLKREYDIGLVRALADGEPEDHTLFEFRRNGKFVFEWVPIQKPKRPGSKSKK
jgi:hypothetical protein